MPRLIIAAAAALAAGAALLVTPTASALPAASATVVIPQGGSGQTSFATVAGEAYTVTATGLFGYDGLGDTDNLADCGHRTTTGPAGTWTRTDFVRVNGSVAGCADQPYSPAHTYQWTVTGTGAPLRFTAGDGLDIDNAGALTFVVTGARARIAHEVTGSCEITGAESSGVPDGVLVHAGATATEDEPAVSTFVDCTVTAATGESATASLGAPGPAVEAGAVLVVDHWEHFEACYVAGATWSDGVTVVNPEVCYEP